MSNSLAEGARWLGAGWLLALSSGFGQTFFVSIFAGHLRADLGLGEGAFGTIYSAATLASAACLMVAGRVADRPRLRGLAAAVLAGLAMMALGMALVPHWTLLAVCLFGLRFLGQGMLSHVSMTGMARWFPTARGKAVSIAALGYPTAEAILPSLAVAGIAVVGWRGTWAAGAAVLLLAALPATLLLLAREPTDRPPGDRGSSPSADHGARQWTRSEVLRDPLFYALQPGILTPPFVLTALWFSQVPIAAAKGWTLQAIAAAMPVYAGLTVLSSLAAGIVVDRVGARRVLAIYLLPLGTGILLLATTEGIWALPVALGLAGMTAGGANTLLGALWAELYGTRHLGAVRGLATSGLVFASALSPALVGLLAEAGIGVERVLAGLGAYTLLAGGLMMVVAAAVGRRRTT